MYKPSVDRYRVLPPLPGIAAGTCEKEELATFPEVENKIVAKP